MIHPCKLHTGIVITLIAGFLEVVVRAVAHKAQDKAAVLEFPGVLRIFCSLGLGINVVFRLRSIDVVRIACRACCQQKGGGNSAREPCSSRLKSC